jgi:hypothetical protein
MVPISFLYPLYMLFVFHLWFPALHGDHGVPLTGTFADPVGSIGSINPNLPQRLYNWFTIFVTKDLSGLQKSPLL